MFAANNTAEEGTTLTFPLGQPQDEHGYNPEDPAGWMKDWAMGLSVPSSFYVAAHTYFPAMLDRGQLKLLDAEDVMSPGRKVYPGCEVQFALQQISPAGKLRRQFYNQGAKTGRLVRLPPELIQAVHERVIRDLRAILPVE